MPDFPGPPGVDIKPTTVPRPRTRRGLFQSLGMGGGGAVEIPERPRTAKHDPILVLVNRITQGFNKAEYERAKTLGYEGYLEEQLDHLSIDDSATDARLAAFPTIFMSPKQLADNHAETPDVPFWELKGATLVRAVYSKRQLFERMVEFWTDHFNIDHQKDPMWAFKPEDDLTVVRQHALGFFPDMLSASAHSGAMMYYLDNWLNIIGNVQENWSRELMELHTMGVNGGFTEDTIKEVAKCFTGWTLNLNFDSPDYLRWMWEPSFHQYGIRTVLGQTIFSQPAEEQGNTVLQILSTHTSTSQFISLKMIKWLLTENPPQELVDEVAQKYLDTGGDIKEMIRIILSKENIKFGDTAWGPKYRRPFHFMTSMLRGLEVEISDPLYLVFYLYFMAHAPFNWVTPDGPPDSVNNWGNSLLPRWVFANHLMQAIIPGAPVSPPATSQLVGGFQTTLLAKRINERLLGKALSRQEVRLVQEYINDLAPLSASEAFEAIGLAASMAGYQWY